MYNDWYGNSTESNQQIKNQKFTPEGCAVPKHTSTFRLFFCKDISMKVFVVFLEEQMYEMNYPVAIFKSREKAEELAGRLNGKSEIQEWTVL